MTFCLLVSTPLLANSLDIKRIEILDPVVTIHGEHATDDKPRHTDPLGAGVVVESKKTDSKWRSVVWTARHLFYEPTWDSDKKDWSWAPRDYDKYWVYVFDHTARTVYSFEFKVLKDDEDLDILIGAFEAPSLGVASLSFDRPKVFQEAYVVGMTINHVPAPASGEISVVLTKTIDGKERDRLYISTAPVTWGYSGGGLFVKTDTGWALAGILVIMPGQNGFPLRHHGGAVPVSLIRDKMGE